MAIREIKILKDATGAPFARIVHAISEPYTHHDGFYLDFPDQDIQILINPDCFEGLESLENG
jgi:hypothetical protein